METKIASSFEEILIIEETHKKTPSRLTMEQSVKLKHTIQLKSHLMTSDKCICTLCTTAHHKTLQLLFECCMPLWVLHVKDKGEDQRYA